MTNSDADLRIAWPTLDQLTNSEVEREVRQEFIGGSDANIILSGNAEKIIELWQVKRGERPSPDLSDKLPVLLGCWTEPFNRLWFEKLTGRRVTQAGRTYVCRVHPWRRCTVDGIIAANGCVWEAKHTNAFAKNEEVLERYMPQLQHNMAVTGHQQASLSVIFGNQKFEVFEVAADWLYQLELLDAEQEFWDCVVSGRPPVAIDPPAAPRPIGTREICLEGNNAWASAAFDWLQHRKAAKMHSAACSSIKSLIEDDVSRAFGHGIEAKRSKSGAITIKDLA